MGRPQRLLVSVRGPQEALRAAEGGAHIADVEYPASALGTPYPLNIATVRKKLSATGFRRIAVSTNIGEVQDVRASACQAALGVAVSGADVIKFGLAEQTIDSGVYLGKSIVRTVRELSPQTKQLIPTVFVDDDMRRFFDPFEDGPELARACRAEGLLIDTFNKLIGKALLDYCGLQEIAAFVRQMHRMRKEAWIAGSIRREEMPALWDTGVDVVCVRGAACTSRAGAGRFAQVSVNIVRALIDTMPT